MSRSTFAIKSIEFFATEVSEDTEESLMLLPRYFSVNSVPSVAK